MAETTLRNVVFVDGCRTPFQRSGTGYQSQSSYDLGRLALKGLLHRSLVDPELIDEVILGSVVQEITTSNLAREVALASGLSVKTRAYTVTAGCISANEAITNACNAIRTGQANVCVAGGSETFSDIPIRYKKKFRQKLLALRKYKRLWDYRKFFLGLWPSDLLPEVPDIAEFSTRLSMGQTCDRMAARLGVSRREQDEYSMRSHKSAAKATRDGVLAGEMCPLRVPPEFKTISDDNGIRDDSSMEKLASLPPAFVKKYGTVTAGNSSFLTDGAAMVLLMAEDTAKALGYKAAVAIRDFVYTAHDPLEELLLGPAWAIPLLLDRHKLKLADIAVFEFHEAFAGQVLSVLKCLNSDHFAQEKLARITKVGEVPFEKLNTLGGSLSLGHPFGATGARLLTTAARRLVRENGQFALIASCAAGAMASAILLEKIH
jgi:acetyl-CoA acyltransferase